MQYEKGQLVEIKSVAHGISEAYKEIKEKYVGQVAIVSHIYGESIQLKVSDGKEFWFDKADISLLKKEEAVPSKEFAFKKGDKVLVTRKLVDDMLPNGRKWIAIWHDEMDEAVGMVMFVTEIKSGGQEIRLAVEPAEEGRLGRADGINGYLYPPCVLRLIERDGKRVSAVGMKVKVVRSSDWEGWTEQMTEDLVGNEYTVVMDCLHEETPTVQLNGIGYFVPLDAIEFIEENDARSNEKKSVALESWEKF